MRQIYTAVIVTVRRSDHRNQVNLSTTDKQ